MQSGKHLEGLCARGERNELVVPACGQARNCPQRILARLGQGGQDNFSYNFAERPEDNFWTTLGQPNWFPWIPGSRAPGKPQAIELPFFGAAAGGREDDRASRIAGRDARSQVT